MNKHLSRLLFVVLGLTLSGSVFAHPGHQVGNFMSGVSHPLTGWDHMTVMLAIGFWSASVLRRNIWLPVAVFASAMVVGFGIGANGVSLLNPEPGIMASVIFMGLLLLNVRKRITSLSIALIGVFAVFHGYAHGIEMPQMAHPLAFASGMLFTTIALHMAGIVLGRLCSRLNMGHTFSRTIGVILSGLGLIGILLGNI